MAVPTKILDAATATGAGAALDLSGVVSTFTMQTIVTGAPSAFGVKLEGSLDGVVFFDITSMAVTAVGGKTNNDPAGVTFGVRYVRANVTSLTGGTAPTVTVWLARH